MDIPRMMRYMEEHTLDAVFAMDQFTTAFLRRFWQGGHIRTLRFDDHPCFPVFPRKDDPFVVDYMSWVPPEEVRPDWFKQYYKGRGSGMDGEHINLEVLADALRERGLDRAKIGLDLDEAPYSAVAYLQDLLPHVELVNAQVLFSQLRQVKEPWQIELIREAVAVLETAYLDTLKQVKEGVTARELARHQMAQCIKGGMIMSWCSPLDIASRWFPQQPEELHLYMSEEDWPVKRNDEIEIFWDMGGERQGYNADMSRAFYLGTPPDDMVAKYEQLARWQVVARNTIVRDMPVAEAYEAMRAALMKEFGFVWGFLHGIGIFAHENPYLDLGLPLDRLTTARNDLRFEVGTVMAFEPFRKIDPDDPDGLKGEEGGCIEDDWLMTEEGWQRLGSLPQKLFVID